jgi:hypothetical protein
MDFICKVEFAGDPAQCFTRRFQPTLESLLGMALFVRVSMISGSSRTTISNGDVSVSIETSSEWLERDEDEMAECILKLVTRATEQRRKVLVRMRANLVMAVGLRDLEECVD